MNVRFLLIENKNGMARVSCGSEPKTKQQKRDEEARFLELKIAFKQNNPSIRENLEYWKKLVEEKKWYGLAIWIDYDKAFIEYCPLKTKTDFESLRENKKEGTEHGEDTYTHT